MDKLRIGVLGSGDIATRISNTILNMEEVEMYAVASRNYDHARSFGEKFGYKKIYKTYDEVMMDPDVDLVYIALHHTQHYEYAKKCIQYKKPVLCEKPFTINHYQAEDLIREFTKEGLFLNEALWTRFIPARTRITKLLEDGVIGTPKMIDVNMICRICGNIRMTDIHMGGGALLDLGVYALNFASMFFGSEVEEVKTMASFWETGVDEQEVFALKYPQGKIAVCKVSMVGNGSVQGIIYGTEGRIEVSDVMNLGHVTVYNIQNEVVEEFSAEEGTTGYEYEFLACKQALENGKLECLEMPHSETMLLMEQYDRLRAAWGLDYPCERGLE
ncbi:MAG: Gfo/Idh/MocA family oxidoreductase [Eubacteriales bacterium]|nr:Gfo/Idh/MocA family oxidoreductase [Eubacteriales bacterium]